MKNKFQLTKHAKDVCKRLGISEDFALRIASSGRKYPSKNHEGQWRYSGLGYCAVVDKDDISIITIYKDRIITPLRPSQIKDGVVIKRKK